MALKRLRGLIFARQFFQKLFHFREDGNWKFSREVGFFFEIQNLKTKISNSRPIKNFKTVGILSKNRNCRALFKLCLKNLIFARIIFRESKGFKIFARINFREFSEKLAKFTKTNPLKVLTDAVLIYCYLPAFTESSYFLNAVCVVISIFGKFYCW